MKPYLKLAIASLVITLFSCSQLKKQVAIDDLVGTYNGTPTMVLQWSKLNIGIEDQDVSEKKSEFVVITKDENDNLFIKFDDGIILKLNNIEMAQNGAIFNIPQQDISFKSEEGTFTGNVAGLNENTFGESKCDGFYDSDKKELDYSFAGTLKMNLQGVEYNVPIAVGYYKFKKQ